MCCFAESVIYIFFYVLHLVTPSIIYLGLFDNRECLLGVDEGFISSASEVFFVNSIVSRPVFWQEYLCPYFQQLIS
jgi:hypothetical protein